MVLRCRYCGHRVAESKIAEHHQTCVLASPPSVGSTAQAVGSAPTWYTEDEMRRYLAHNNYSVEIADELAKQYANNLQKAFEKGYDIGKRRAQNQ